jgi:curved DNA-binding protein
MNIGNISMFKLPIAERLSQSLEINNFMSHPTKNPGATTGTFESILELQNEQPTLSLPANKKLSESKLRLAAIQALPTEVDADISLKEALRGATCTITINDPVACAECAKLKPINRMQCQNCKGVTYVFVDRKVEITLPPGLVPGQEIRFPELGRYNLTSGKNSELVVKINIVDHPILKVDGKNLTCTVPVSLYEAVLGTEIEVPTATGKVLMKLQPLTSPGKVYRLRGLGLAGGDQLVTIEVTMPQKLTKEQSQLFYKIKALSEDIIPGNPSES